VRILAIIAEVPNPPIGGARVRNYCLWPLIRALGHKVKIVGLTAAPVPDRPGDSEAMESEYEFYRPARAPLPVRAFSSLGRSHYERGRAPSLVERVDELVGTWKPDVVHAEELRMGYYLPRFRGRHCDALQTVTLHNVESWLHANLGALEKGFLVRLQHHLQMRSLRDYEAKVVKVADLAFAYSPVDFQRYRRMYPKGCWVQTSNGVDAQHIEACASAEGNNLLAVGALSYLPNIRGLLWLFDEVWPRLKRPYALTVAGSGASADLRARIGRAGAKFVDTPMSLLPLYRDSTLSVVPLFEGSGTRSKILEACAYQRLTVTTTLGLEGLDLTPGKEGVVVADDPQDFANAIEFWTEARQERSKIEIAGRAAALARYDWSIVARDMIRHWTDKAMLHAPEVSESHRPECA
jgi:glycosyltransferase involved in cell wall biosynthesis